MAFHLASRKIIKDWTDYNEHMNMAYYILIFDEAWETMLNKFEMGGAKAQINKEVQWWLKQEQLTTMKLKKMKKLMFIALSLIMIRKDYI